MNRRGDLRGELGGELAALLEAGRAIRPQLEAEPLRPGELPRLPEPRVPSHRLTGEAARRAREADYRRELRERSLTRGAELQKQRRASGRAEDVAALEAEVFDEERRDVRRRGRELVDDARRRYEEARAEYLRTARADRRGADRDRARRAPAGARRGEWLSRELQNIPPDLEPLARAELPRIRARLAAAGNARVAPWERFLEEYEAGSYEEHARAPRLSDRELAREAERFHLEREAELAERAAEIGEAFEDLDDERAAELLAELDDDDDPPF